MLDIYCRASGFLVIELIIVEQKGGKRREGGKGRRRREEHLDVCDASVSLLCSRILRASFYFIIQFCSSYLFLFPSCTLSLSLFF